jgi:TPR repeat protein
MGTVASLGSSSTSLTASPASPLSIASRGVFLITRDVSLLMRGGLTLDRDKLAKILGLLGSDKTGEVMSAAQAAAALIRDAKTSWAEVLNQNGVADSPRGVHTDNEARDLGAEFELWRARTENEKLREQVIQLAVEMNDLREQAARRLTHRIRDGLKHAGQALRVLTIAFDGIALVRRQLAARLRDSERRTRRVVVHGLAAAGIALAIGIVAFCVSLQDVAKLGGPSVESGTMASSRQEAPEATAGSNGLPAEAESVSDQPSNAAMATPESIAKPTPSDAGRAPIENMSTLSPTLPSAIAVPDQTAEAAEALSNVASPAREEKQAATSTTSPATSPTATRSPSNQQRQAEIAALVARGDAFLSAGDIVSARLFYERAADGGDGVAALRLGATFDPGFLSRTSIRGAPSDPAQASSWYRRALDLGNSAAQEALRDLEQSRFVAPGANTSSRP